MIPMNTMKTMNKHCFIFTIKINHRDDSYEYYEYDENYE